METTKTKIICRTVLGALLGAAIGGVVGTAITNHAQTNMINANTDKIAELENQVNVLNGEVNSLTAQNQDQEERITELEKQKQYLTCNSIATTEVTVNGVKKSTAFTTYIKANDVVTVTPEAGYQYALALVKYEATDFYADDYYTAKDTDGAEEVINEDVRSESYTFTVEAGMNYFLYATYTAC